MSKFALILVWTLEAIGLAAIIYAMATYSFPKWNETKALLAVGGVCTVSGFVISFIGWLICEFRNR